MEWTYDYEESARRLRRAAVIILVVMLSFIIIMAIVLPQIPIGEPHVLLIKTLYK